MDAQVSGGMTFLQAELEKASRLLIEPVSAVTFPRDIPIEVGGGWLDYTSNFFANYGTTGNNMFGIQANQNSNVARAQADVTKDLFPLYNWQASISIKFIDMQKLMNTPRSVQQIFESSVRQNWNLAQNEMTYYGLVKAGVSVYGIVNDPAVTVTTAAAVGDQNGATNSTLWANKTPQQIANDFSSFITAPVGSCSVRPRRDDQPRGNPSIQLFLPDHKLRGNQWNADRPDTARLRDRKECGCRAGSSIQDRPDAAVHRRRYGWPQSHGRLHQH